MNNLFNTLYASGAYGRTYDCLADVLIDYLEGLDFKINRGPYFSFRDADVLINDGYTHIDINGWLIPVK
jgi:hypothetical protein